MTGSGVGHDGTRGGRAESGGADGVSAVALSLSGDLPCVGCGYNLRGLSVRESCPECGLPAKATILAVVDPRADELAPIARRRVVGWGVLVWAWGALAAAVALWSLRLGGPLLGPGFGYGWARAALAYGAVGLLTLSGVSSLVLLRPHEGISGRAVRRGLFGAAWYLPLVAVVGFLLLRYDVTHGLPSLFGGDVDVMRTRLRLLAWASVVGVMLGLRIPLRVLRARSVPMRTGRVETQRAAALVAAVGLALGGDVIMIGASTIGGVWRDVAVMIGGMAVAVGALLATLWLIGLATDAWRIRKAICRPAVGLADVLTPERRGGV